MRYFWMMNKIILCGILLLLAGCSSPTVKLNLQATHAVNQDETHHALPVVVRVYTLSRADNFKDATFNELWHHDKTILANTLISRQAFTLNPNTRLSLHLEQAKEARYLAVVALFRHPWGGKWRIIYPLPGDIAATFTSVTIVLAGNAITLK